MAKYLLYFEKRGLIKYTSHLDLLRIYKRAFKKASIPLAYSEGFNPHPKLFFGQPLPLGYEGAKEPLEFSTKEEVSAAAIKTRLNLHLPKGLQVLNVISAEDDKSPLTGTLKMACYKIRLPLGYEGGDLESQVNNFMDLKEICAEKQNRKKKTASVIDIRPLIVEMSGFYENETPVLSCLLMAGSNENLSPEIVLESFFKYVKADINRNEIHMERLYLKFE